MLSKNTTNSSSEGSIAPLFKAAKIWSGWLLLRTLAKTLRLYYVQAAPECTWYNFDLSHRRTYDVLVIIVSKDSALKASCKLVNSI